MKTAFLIPKQGVKVRNPNGIGHISETGEERILNTYWNRRIADGDLIIREDKKKEPPAPQDKNSEKAGKKSVEKGVE